jgi:prolyl-tRNA synthetase
MRLSKLFGRRQRESAGGAAAASHDLLLRAGYVRQHAAGIYSYLPLGLAALRRIEAIVREEMDRTGAQEILLPMVQSADVWRASGRYDTIDATLVRFRDRRGHDLVLGMTHEEVVAQLAASEVQSYRQAGLVVYQIQTKFRDEARARGGLLRTREFLMKDAYSLDVDPAGLDDAYAAQTVAYGRVFHRAGLRDVRVVRSATGDMGGDGAHEFMALLDVGEDTVALCDGCGEAWNVELLASADACQMCGAALSTRRAVEVGNTFRLGRRYAEALGACPVDRSGQRRPLLMGSYGLGVSRLLAALVEQYHDARGIALPAAVAPADAHIVALGGDGLPAGAADAERSLQAAGLRVLYDDRAVHAGEMLADADLIGAPLRVLFGGRARARDAIEVRERRSGEVHEVAAGDAVEAVLRIHGDLIDRAAGAVDR